MTTQDFCYWLQGLFEVADPKTLDEKQVQIIKDHLVLVFNKITPPRLEYHFSKEEVENIRTEMKKEPKISHPVITHLPYITSDSYWGGGYPSNQITGFCIPSRDGFFEHKDGIDHELLARLGIQSSVPMSC